VAKRLGAAASFSNMPFADLIASLRAKKCDAIISFMNDTAQRRQLVAFVDYLAAGQSLPLRKGSPPITDVGGLSGKTVAVLHGTTEELFLQNANRHLNGRPPIKIVPYSTDNEAIYALAQGKADAAFDDTPTVACAAAHNKALVEWVQLHGPIPIGIALRKGDPRIPKVERPSGHGSRRHTARDGWTNVYCVRLWMHRRPPRLMTESGRDPAWKPIRGSVRRVQSGAARVS
jgi:ABC-type amino acid transport substrate-binding protein